MATALTLHRPELGRALYRLGVTDLKVLLGLLHDADSETGRIKLKRADLATRLALSVSFFTRSLERLYRHGFVALMGHENGADTLDVGPILRRLAGPANLPLDPNDL